MRRLMMSAVTGLFLMFLTASSAHALLGVKYGVDVTVISPMGDWGDGAGLGLGAMGRLELDIPGPLSITARAGYIHHLEKHGVGSSTVPMLLGAKFGMGLPGVGLYVYGEGGWFRISLSAPGMSVTNTEIGMTLGVGAGIGPLDARLGIVLPDVGEITEAFGVMANVGYNF